MNSRIVALQLIHAAMNAATQELLEFSRSTQ
jgi:hypothetical protein